MTPQETCLWVSGSLQRRCGSVVACCRVGARTVAVHAWDLFREVIILTLLCLLLQTATNLSTLNQHRSILLFFLRPEMSSVSNKRTVLLLDSPDHNSFSCPFPILEDMVKLLPLANSPHVYLHNTFSVSYWFCSNIFLSSRYFLNLFFNQDYLSLSLFIYNFIVLTFIMILVKLPYISYVKSGYSFCFLLHI